MQATFLINDGMLYCKLLNQNQTNLFVWCIYTRFTISDEAKSRTHFLVVFTLLYIGSWYHYIWLLAYVLDLIINTFNPKWRCSPKKRSSPILLPPIVLLAVSSTKSKLPVQTNGSDLASHEQATSGEWHKNAWHLSTFPWRNAKILTYDNPNLHYYLIRCIFTKT